MAAMIIMTIITIMMMELFVHTTTIYLLTIYATDAML